MVGVDSTLREDAAPLFALAGDSTEPPILVGLVVNNKAVQFELDTGGSTSVMSEAVYSQLFPESKLQKPSVDLKTYTGELLAISGEARVEVTNQGQGPFYLPLMVVQGCGPALLGRNWLQHLTLDWRCIKAVCIQPSPLNDLLEQCKEIFNQELGTITLLKAQLSVSPTAIPRFHRPCPVAYALHPLVEQELDRLEGTGVLEKIDHSKWAAPIVAVPKRDGNVRVCGDSKVTINPVLAVDQYPLPCPQDLFATLARGKYSTTLDLSHAYNQIVLEEDARQYLTINTH